ncbi:protein TIFY 10A isoform X1 [Eucalyptus grandis]|uniref:protein TIFY 10A isoform X1 n=1 Tax=Eucalyptus grandis TaxID=71139 RepID=UPI000524B740|nr:protein TIFY 10A isoform X1 [Eucalyptus grandis]
MRLSEVTVAQMLLPPLLFSELQLQNPQVHSTSSRVSSKVEQARRWKQVTNRTPQYMTLEAAQLQLVGHDHPLFLPTSNKYPFDFNRKRPPFLEGYHDAALKFPFPKEVHHGPALGEISSVGPSFISQAQTTDASAKGSLGHTPEIRSEAMLSQGPALLTIFYGDGVYVYSDITPEKAELIMSMAREQPTTLSTSQAQHLEVASNIHRPRATYPQGTLPQARRATLVRFLEKRKDRLSSDIYNLIKKSSESTIFPQRS